MDDFSDFILFIFKKIYLLREGKGAEEEEERISSGLPAEWGAPVGGPCWAGSQNTDIMT